jgi:hypothetical protein
MSTLLSSALILSNVLLATMVFVVLARPRAGAKWVQRVMNPKRAMWEAEMSPEEEAQCSRMAGTLAWFGLLILGGWSFAVGTALAILKM